MKARLGTLLRPVAAVGVLLIGIAVHSSVTSTQHERDTYAHQLHQQQVTADAEREQLLAGQRELERRLDVMVRGDERLLRYLGRHGVVVPHRLTRFLTVATSQSTRAPAPDLPGRSDTHRRSR